MTLVTGAMLASDALTSGPISTITPLHQSPIPHAEVVRLLAAWTDDGRADDLTEHEERYGRLPSLLPGRGVRRHLLIDSVRRAGLRGRGGAGFPTAEKLTAVAAAKGRAVVVANGCEGDPTSSKDHTLMQLAPHLVLDGIAVACYAVDAADAVLCLHQGSPALEPMRAALAQRRDPVPVMIAEVPPRYVASESSALVNFLTTGAALPTTGPRAAERGVKGRPTLVDNVETLAHLALIARYGDEWFREAGTQQSPGSTLLTIGGAVTWPGVYEVEYGIPISDALELAGGESESLQAVAVGGLGGTWLPVSVADELPLTHEDFAALGLPLGIPSIVALPAQACGVAETARVLRYLAHESAGQCGPCMFGLPAVAEDFALLAAGRRDRELLDRLERRLGVVPGRGACSHPDAAIGFAARALSAFADDVRAHAAGRPCRWAAQQPWMPLPEEAA
ncbi:NADH dehydrogenase subunit F [Pseudonocardia thermophila]|uniref:NADH dehydrogenase subunit F n=1 Tax=Pseudonocardia thermophila TaxID=1848 RepID=A0A1M6YCT3_PSETH|nr:NADH-ubiquinone oxidoreductase-F iron-sulfur binding region domain-containing protein [Pseudonocardia thermophila]SHL15779.1 NADH dehydrogenase subunit F [Pseudonocardia thermophila]